MLRIEGIGSLDVKPFRRGSVLRIEGIGSLDVKPFRRVSVLRIEDTGSVDAKLLEMNVQPRPLRDITDDEWLKIMRIRSTPVRGQPDAEGAWKWLKLQGVNIGRTAFDARVGAKLQCASMQTAGAWTAGEVGATPTAALVPAHEKRSAPDCRPSRNRPSLFLLRHRSCARSGVRLFHAHATIGARASSAKSRLRGRAQSPRPRHRYRLLATRCAGNACRKIRELFCSQVECVNRSNIERATPQRRCWFVLGDRS